MVIVTNQVGSAHSLPFLVRNANFRLIDVFCDSFEKIIFKKAVTAKLMMSIHNSVAAEHFCCASTEITKCACFLLENLVIVKTDKSF